MSNTDPDTFLNSAMGVPAAKFSTVGDTLKGKITAVDVGQCRDFETQQLAYWPDGNPKEQLIVTLQTDDISDEDDGKRRIFAPKPSNMLQAIGDALKEASKKAGQPLPGLRPGGILGVRFVGEKPHEKAHLNPIKQYQAAYAAPTEAAADELLVGTAPAAIPQPAPSASEDLLGV